MTAFFSRILNMSLTGSVVIGIVLVARFLLKRSPKIYSYALWAVVLFRLLCPISFSAPISMLNLVQPEVTVASERTSVVTFLPTVQTPADTKPEFQQMAPVVETQPKTLETKEVISIIWLVGVGAMAACSVVQYLHLRKRLVGAMRYRDNVYLSDYIESPFVMGIISPNIYMPSAIPAQERKYILAHERHHIRRGDPVWKLLGYAALCIHWFNPLVWVAFILAGKDMEMSCDEAVIRKFGPEIRADYSASLLRLATHRNTIAGMPLAFGEGDTKGRVMNMAKWKKPKVWLSILCAVACILVITACAVNPKEDGLNPTGTQIESNQPTAQMKKVNAQIDPFPEGYSYTWDDDGSILFMDGTNTVGGITCYAIPEGVYDPDDSNFFWLEKVGIPDFEDPTLNFEGGMTSGDGWLAEFKSSTSDGAEPAVYRRHHFYPVEGLVYDIWFDRNRLEYETTEDLRACVHLSSAEPAEYGTIVGTNIELVQYGDFRMALPEGYTCRKNGDTVILMKDGVDIGGIACWKHPGFEPDDMIQWLRALGLPELQEGYDIPIGYMAGGSTYGDMEIEIFHDGNPEDLNVQHEIFIDGDLVYDVYFDQNLITDGQADYFLKTIQVSGEPVVSSEEMDAEEAAYQKCEELMDGIQSGSYKIVSKLQPDGTQAPAASSWEYDYHEGDYLSINTVSHEAYLSVDHKFFRSEGQQKEAGDITWVETDQPMDYSGPWLNCFCWDKSYVSYEDTLSDEDGECLMFRVDKMFEDSADHAKYYFANFYFDPEGNFTQVRMQVNPFMDNAYTVAESIVSMDPETIAGEIEKEYQRAIG